ncbi:MAG TPA: IS200/IS605 family transposase [Pyrinomonadaceae bacterium]|nr:IS200/IS605 family transposase [Pyrinomonadaceae bacterium]
MSHTHTNLLIHIIFSTKDRMPLIDSDINPRLHAYLGGIVRELKGTALSVNGTMDHVHMLIGLPPTVALSDVVRVTKANSSRWIHEQIVDKKFGWQSGYGAFSVSQSKAQTVLAYIAHQEAHHRKISFK